MKVYTKTGDKGQTTLFNGDRVAKDDARVQAYGALDECNSFLGVARSMLSQELKNKDHAAEVIEKAEEISKQLEYIQNCFFDLGAHLATPRKDSDETAIKKTEFRSELSVQLEQWIDQLDEDLKPLTHFILPGGHVVAAQLHVARATSRRVERAATPLINDGEVEPAAFTFLNRVSDYFFVASRFVNEIFGHEDVQWTKVE